MVTDRLIVPLKLFRLNRDRDTVPEDERGILMVDVLAVREKSGARRTITMTVVECEKGVELPVMVTV